MAKNWNEIASRWTRFSRDVKKRWNELTDDDLLDVNGRREILTEKIKEKYDITTEVANNQIDAWASKLKG